MIRFLDGGSSLYAAKRPFFKPILLILILASFVLAACAAGRQSTNWPGMSADGDKVYVAFGPAVLAYDTATQQEDWIYPSEDERSQLQYYTAPSVLDGRVVFGDFGRATSMINPRQIVSIYGLSDPPGAPSDWQNDSLAQDKIIAPPLQIGDRAFIATGDSKLFAIDITDEGNPVWPAPFEVENPIWGPMAYDDGTIYAAAMDGNVYAIDAETGTENGRWETDTSFPGGVTLDGDTLYAGAYDQKLHAFDKTSTGSEFWVFDADAGIWGAPVVVDGQVFFGDTIGNVYAVEAETGELIWKKAVDGPIVTSPAAADGVIYIASEGDPDDRTEEWFLTAFTAEDGTQLWQQTPAAGIYTTPAVVGDSVIGVLFGDENDLLIAYDKMTGTLQWTYAPES
jgi:outer membrane protein assembly factor BamB